MFCFVSFSFSQTNNQEIRNPNAPANTIKIPNTEIYVSENDENSPMRYTLAKSTCACKGTGWRLPTIGELQLIYNNKNIFENFSKNWYWALDPAGAYAEGHHSTTYRFYNLNFKNGKVNDEEEDETNNVRCIWSPLKPE